MLTRKIFVHMQTVIVLLLFISPAYAAARQLNSIDLIERAYRNGEIRRSESLNYKVNAIFRPESVPAVYRSKGIIKSATPVLMEARLNRHLLSRENNRILAMGRVAILTDLYSGAALQSYASPQGRFRIHFTTDNTKGGDAVPSFDVDANGVPDYVERFADILDDVWTTEVEVMGYDAPPSDGTEGGDCLLDVYLAHLNAYGYTQIDEGDPATLVYMIFENDFAIDFPPNTDPEGNVAGAMKVVAAHEFFHTIQFQITEDICTNGWWMEASATWMEDYIFPDVNDYINYIDYWFQKPWLPLNTYDCSGSNLHTLFPYGTTIWIKHMTEKYGSEFVFDVWSKIRADSTNVTALSAVTEALTDRGTTLEQELKELRVANVTMTYEDAYWYQNWQLEMNPAVGPIEVTYSGINTDISSSTAYSNVPLSPLSAKYYSFSPLQATGNLQLDFDSGGNISVMVVGIKPGGYDVTELTIVNNTGSITINGFGSSDKYRRVVVIPVNSSDTIEGSFNLTASYITTYAGNISSVEIKPGTASLVTGDNGINAKQQYHLIMMDDSNSQVLKEGITWTDMSQYIDIDGSGLAVLTGAVANETISASLLPQTATSRLSAVSPAVMTAGAARVCEVIINTAKNDSRCFIATAAFGSSLHPYVALLREFRDRYLLSNTPGRWIVSLYYSSSPPIAEIVSDNPWLKAMVKIFLIPAIIISWAMVKLTLGEIIIIALLLVAACSGVRKPRLSG